MNDYKYKGIPLSPSIAAELALEFVSSSRNPVKRDDILKFVVQKHVSSAGTAANDAEATLKKALSSLVTDGRLVRPSVGWYRVGQSTLAGEELDNSALATLDEAVGGDGEQLPPRHKLGSGAESVYLYYQSSDERLARLEGRDHWPCKIGFTAGLVTTRILSQGALTSIAVAPIVGLVIATDDGRMLERAIHAALDQAGTRIDEGFGTEWFQTSPERVVSWYESYRKIVDGLKIAG
ncbi:MAG: GIY-YIG nuclease family protein [Rhizomicrobium sp.]